MKRRVLRVPALVGEVIRRFVLRANLDQLRLLCMVLAEVDTEPALTSLYVLHGNLRRIIRTNRGVLTIACNVGATVTGRGGIIRAGKG